MLISSSPSLHLHQKLFHRRTGLLLSPFVPHECLLKSVTCPFSNPLLLTSKQLLNSCTKLLIVSALHLACTVSMVSIHGCILSMILVMKPVVRDKELKNLPFYCFMISWPGVLTLIMHHQCQCIDTPSVRLLTVAILEFERFDSISRYAIHSRSSLPLFSFSLSLSNVLESLIPPFAMSLVVLQSFIFTSLNSCTLISLSLSP